MQLRKLKTEDAPLMLEWMHDPAVVGHLHADFSSKTLQDAQKFITDSWENKANLHLAIVSDEDEYERARSIALRKHLSGKDDFSRIMRALASKGFPSSIAYRVARDLTDED